MTGNVDISNLLSSSEWDQEKQRFLFPLMFTCLAIGIAYMMMRRIKVIDCTIIKNPHVFLRTECGARVWWSIFRMSRRRKQSSNHAAQDTILHRSLSSIGRFALRSQTTQNPSIISFFVALSNKKGTKEMSQQDFGKLIQERVVTTHERFRSRICSNDDRYFEVFSSNDILNFISSPSHPTLYHNELAARMHESMTSDLDVVDRLWEVQISTGPMGSSGAIRKEIASKLVDTHDRETVVIFRVHHALCDGVSLSVAMGNLCDESNQLDAVVAERKRKHKERQRERSVIQRMVAAIRLAVFYIFGSVYALSLQAWRMLVSVNPFEQVIAALDDMDNTRASTWKYMDSLEGMKHIAKNISMAATINDLAVACVTGALYRQLAEHEKEMKAKGITLKVPNHLNIVIPFHLHGGVIPKGESLGNKIGAFVTAIPARGSRSPAAWMKCVSKQLAEGKVTPAPLISWYIAKFFSSLTPLWVSKQAIRHGNGHASAVVSNVRGFPITTHWNGNRLEHVSAFLPLPPGIPIGVVIQSHDGSVSFTVEAERRAVPDVIQFSEWVIEAYNEMKAAASLYG